MITYNRRKPLAQPLRVCANCRKPFRNGDATQRVYLLSESNLKNRSNGKPYHSRIRLIHTECLIKLKQGATHAVR